MDATIAAIPTQRNPALRAAVAAHWNDLTKPQGSLGALESAVTHLASIQECNPPTVDRQAIYLFCGDHGITESGVSAYPSAVTREMMKNFVAGGAAINVLCRQFDIATHVVDAGVTGPSIPGVLDYRIAEGTRNFAHEPAMSREQTLAALEAGVRLATDAAAVYDIVGLGEMGIGNTSAATALVCAFTGADPLHVAGRGAGLDDAGLQHKQAVLQSALTRHSLGRSEPLDILSTFGGFEIAMMAGFHLGAAAHKLPTVVDGLISSAAFLAAYFIAGQQDTRPLTDFALFAHRSAEPGHIVVLERLQVQPLLALGLRLGEGTGSALAMNLLRAAVALYREMATFSSAAVSQSTQ